MASPLSSLYTLSFAIATLATLLVAATLRLLAILPSAQPRPNPWRKRPLATRVLIVLGSGGHTHEMFYLLQGLDTSKYTHRTYIVSSGDAFSAQRAVHFEKELEQNAKHIDSSNNNNTARTPFLGPDHYNIAVVPRARNIYQPIFTTPFSAMYCLASCFAPLLNTGLGKGPASLHERAANDLPDLIITNGPATAVIVILASLILRFFNIKGADSRGKCKTIYAESFARVKGLSLSGKLLSRVVDRFLVQWEELEGAGGGRAEFWGILV